MQTKGYKSCEHIWLKSIYIDLDDVNMMRGWILNGLDLKQLFLKSVLRHLSILRFNRPPTAQYPLPISSGQCVHNPCRQRLETALACHHSPDVNPQKSQSLTVEHVKTRGKHIRPKNQSVTMTKHMLKSINKSTFHGLLMARKYKFYEHSQEKNNSDNFPCSSFPFSIFIDAALVTAWSRPSRTRSTFCIKSASWKRILGAKWCRYRVANRHPFGI